MYTCSEHEIISTSVKVETQILLV